MSSKEIYLVIGGSGFLGRHIVEALQARGDSVCTFDIVQKYHDVPHYTGNIIEQTDVEDTLRKSGTTCIIHTASPNHGLDDEIYWKVNVEGTKAIIAAAVAIGVRKLVYTSSAVVVFNGADIIGGDERLPYTEKHLDVYAETKLKAEQLVLAANGKDNLLTVALRPAGIFGPGDKQVLAGLIKIYQTRQTHFQVGNNTNLFDYTYVTNVAKAHLLAADKLSVHYNESTSSKILAKYLPPIDLSTGNRRLPTTNGRPLGPAVELTARNEKLDLKFRGIEEEDPRPVVRSRFDQFSDASLEVADYNTLQVAGQVFFITNGEPVYFWDLPRAVWRALGDPMTRSTIKLPRNVGLFLASLSECYGWLVGKEVTFTRFRVTFSCATRWFNIEKARRVLGYEPEVGMKEGLERLMEWVRNEQQAI